MFETRRISTFSISSVLSFSLAHYTPATYSQTHSSYLLNTIDSHLGTFGLAFPSLIGMLIPHNFQLLAPSYYSDLSSRVNSKGTSLNIPSLTLSPDIFCHITFKKHFPLSVNILLSNLFICILNL